MNIFNDFNERCCFKMLMSKEEFESRFPKGKIPYTYKEYLKCACENCKNSNCIHRNAFRRLPQSGGGLGLCPNLNKK